MRITDKKPHDRYRAAPLPFFLKHEALFGHVLSDDFEDPHIHVYEHARYSFQEMSDHPPITGTPETYSELRESLFEEEKDVLSVLDLKEPSQMLTIIGDVGSGKSTFLRHLCSVHFGQDPFGDINPIYLDWNSFTASLTNPLPDIYNKFSEEIYNELEIILDSNQWKVIDKEIFETSKLFSVERNGMQYVSESLLESERGKLIREKMLSHPVEFAIERLNAICKENPNKVVLIIDNIDHLRPVVLDSLQDFLREIRIKTLPLLIVALRDHTIEKGWSGYDRLRVKPFWSVRIYCPDIRKVVLRRLDFFFPTDVPKGSGKDQETDKGMKLIVTDDQLKRSCRALLLSPFEISKTYEFLRRWSNYNVRDAFRCISQIITFPGLAEQEGELSARARPLQMSIDDCVIALALGYYQLFYPHRSAVFNMYSAAAHGDMSDILSGVRILQYLAGHKKLIQSSVLIEKFSRYGYKKDLLDRQIHWMAAKDVIWTDAGDPSDLDPGTNIRLSYRGKLYESTLLRRVTYNYLMSFNVYAPAKEHPIARDWRSEFNDEVAAFFRIGAKLSGDALILRVSGLASVLYQAEKEEIRQLRSSRLLNEYKAEIAPKSASAIVLSGLSDFVKTIITRPESIARPVEEPSHRALAEIGELQEAVRSEIQNAIM